MIGIKRQKKIENWIISFISVTIGLILIFPVVYALFGSFQTTAEFASGTAGLIPKDWTYFENYKRVLELIPVGRYFMNSFIVALLGTIVRLAISVCAAYAFTFYEFKGKKLLFYFTLATMMLPPDTLLIQNYLTVSKLGLLDSYLGMSITFFVGASQMFMLRQKFMTMKKEFRDAAFIDGCGDGKFLWYILLPMAKPVLLTLGVQSFATLWNTYLWPLLVTNSNEMRTIQVGITMLNSVEDSNYPLILAGVVLAIIPVLLLFIMFRKKIVKGATTGGALIG